LERTLEVRRTIKEKVLGDISKGSRGLRALLKYPNTLHVHPSKLAGGHEFTKGNKRSREGKGLAAQCISYLLHWNCQKEFISHSRGIIVTGES